jgi:hypothetical protein
LGIAAPDCRIVRQVGQQAQQQQRQQHPLQTNPTCVCEKWLGVHTCSLPIHQRAQQNTSTMSLHLPPLRCTQVGSTADEWTSALGAVHRLAGCRCGRSPNTTPTTCPGSASSSYGGAGSSTSNTAAGSRQAHVLSHAAAAAAAAAGPGSGGGAPSSDNSAAGSRCGSCGGCLPGAGLASQPAAGAVTPSSSSSSSGPSELLAELSHLPCFLLMEYVEGDRLSDSPQALQVRGHQCSTAQCSAACMRKHHGARTPAKRLTLCLLLTRRSPAPAPAAQRFSMCTW